MVIGIRELDNYHFVVITSSGHEIIIILIQNVKIDGSHSCMVMINICRSNKDNSTTYMHLVQSMYEKRLRYIMRHHELEKKKLKGGGELHPISVGRSVGQSSSGSSFIA